MTLYPILRGTTGMMIAPHYISYRYVISIFVVVWYKVKSAQRGRSTLLTSCLESGPGDCVLSGVLTLIGLYNLIQ